jgi:hypothetical protein
MSLVMYRILHPGCRLTLSPKCPKSDFSVLITTSYSIHHGRLECARHPSSRRRRINTSRRVSRGLAKMNSIKRWILSWRPEKCSRTLTRRTQRSTDISWLCHSVNSLRKSRKNRKPASTSKTGSVRRLSIVWNLMPGWLLRPHVARHAFPK